MGQYTRENGSYLRRSCGLAAIAWLAMGQPSLALDKLNIRVSGGEKLEAVVRQASLVLAQRNDGQTEAEDLFTAARADYARILAALYAEGYYTVTIRISLDGREAAQIAPLDAPKRIGQIDIVVDPGDQFKFGNLVLGPLARDTELPPEFKTGEVARAGAVENAVDVATKAWRERSYAKVAVADSNVVANHPSRSVSTAIRLNPGPALRFGPLSVKGAERMDVRRILKISGIREGETFSQSELDRATNRLRRSGVFSSVTLVEADRIVGGDLLPIEITVAEQKTRRYSIGAEFSSVDGIGFNGMWMHRNLLGGAERLRVDAMVTNIGSGDSGVDYELGVSIERPATLTADTTAGLLTKIGHLDEVDYALDYAKFGLNFTQYLSEQLTARAGLTYEYVRGSDPQGDFIYRNLALPLGVTWDRRDSTTDALKGFYIDATAKPFYGLSDTASGVKLTTDLRGFRSFADERFTVAARIQGGAVLGSTLFETPRDDLFFSGGGGTVRGQPYRSLGIEVPVGTDSFTIGGTQFAAASLELRGRFGGSWGGVAFVDAGYVGDDGASESHAGAGVGVRYDTGFGPIRFDVAAPISGKTGDGVQIYIGLGQSF